MKKTLYSILSILSIFTLILPASPVSATLTPAPVANFSPIFGNSTTTNFNDISFSVSPNGHPGLVGKNLTVVPYICNGSGLYSFYDCEIDEYSVTGVYFADSSSYESITFSNLALYYLGNNYIMCYIYDPASQNGDFCGGSTYEGDPDYKQVSFSGGLLPVYRFWSDTNSHHFYTIDHGEKESVEDNYNDSTWRYEQPAFFAYRSEVCVGSPVYRFWSDTKQSHFYTIDVNERNYITSNYPTNVWNYEGVAYCAQAGATTSTPVYRFWSNTMQGHFYTTDEGEKDYIISHYSSDVWNYESVAFWAYK